MLLASMICYLLGILLLSKSALTQTTLPDSSSDEPTTISTTSDEPTATSSTSFLTRFPQYYLQRKLIKLKNVSGTENSSHQCVYVSTPRAGENRFNVTWDCEAGYYCLGPNAKYPCTAGFFCPPNSSVVRILSWKCNYGKSCELLSTQHFHPNSAACEGYYCSRDATKLTLCPSGYFCTLGTVDPISCHYLALCPPGSSSANKYFLVLFVLVLAATILILLQIKRKSDQLKMMKYQQYLHDKRPLSAKTLGSVPKYFDIEFENL
ncbi:13272_t:CDS:2, partial [Acaulospora morrowiae]